MSTTNALPASLNDLFQHLVTLATSDSESPVSRMYKVTDDLTSWATTERIMALDQKEVRHLKTLMEIAGECLDGDPEKARDGSKRFAATVKMLGYR